MVTKSIQVYADVINIVSESSGINVLMTGIDPSQVISEFNVDEVLDNIDVSYLEKYLTAKLKEEE